MANTDSDSDNGSTDFNDFDDTRNNATDANVKGEDTTSENAQTEDDAFSPGWGLDETQQKEGVHETHVRGLGPAKVEFLNFEDIRKYQQTGSGAAMLQPRVIARILGDHFHEPDLKAEGLTSQKVKTMKPTVPGAMLDAITNDNINVEMQDDGVARIEADETARNGSGE